MESLPRDIQLTKLTERAKELRCLYRVMEILNNEKAELHSIFTALLEAIPPGWQYPTVCESRIIFEGKEYASVDFKETPWMIEAELIIDDHFSGKLQVAYIQKVFESDKPFLPEEQKLLKSIAESLSRFIFFRRLRKTIQEGQSYENGDLADDRSLLAYESDEHWKWRYQVAEKIASSIDMERFGVEAIYLIGSAKAGNAGPASDIDLLVHFRGKEDQRKALEAFMEGWGLGLAELNFIRTGYTTKGSLIDFHLITDEDIQKQTSYACMIGSNENSAKLLRAK